MSNKKLKAIFIGQDGSCGFKNGLEYELELTHHKSGSIQIDSVGKYCDYGSINSFLNNWDNIKSINYKSISFPTKEEIETEAESRYPVNTHHMADLSPFVDSKKTFVHGVNWAINQIQKQNK